MSYSRPISKYAEAGRLPSLLSMFFPIVIDFY